MNIVIPEETKVDYSLWTENFAYIKFDNGLNVSLTREQAEAIVKGFEICENNQKVINKLKLVASAQFNN
jgi:hypothetical protein